MSHPFWDCRQTLRAQPELARCIVMRAFGLPGSISQWPWSRWTGFLWAGLVYVASDHWCLTSQVSTGNLLVILSRHYQDVSCLKFTGDGSHFVSAGKDCLVLAWSLCR